MLAQIILRDREVTKVEEEVRIKGAPVSRGVAIGALYILQSDEKWSVPEFTISPTDIDNEIARYRTALHLSGQELDKLMIFLQEEGSGEAISIVEAHRLMLLDPVVTHDVETKIATTLKNTESIFVKEMGAYIDALMATEDPIIRQRVLDIKDLLARVLRHLHPTGALSCLNIPSQSIVCANELAPSQTAEASPNQIRAVVTKFGGSTSHAALIAKAKGIPYISNIDMSGLDSFGGAIAIVDGHLGEVIIHPSQETLNHYNAYRKDFCEPSINYGGSYIATDRTLDNKIIEVQANLEDLHDLYFLKELRTKTIGLIRSEFLYLKNNVDSFCEAEQFELYKKLMQLSGNMEVTFRIFDIGSDKRFVHTEVIEPNPALGCRSIRFLINHPKVFSTQVRAVLRAAKYGKMKLLLPLISDLHELREAKAFIENVKQDLKDDRVDFCEEIEIGCMVEVPAFVIMCDLLVRECDFVSIGTNDLAQYTFAADRSNPSTADRYRHDHPALVRMIKRVVDEAENAGIDVSICGEIASDPAYTELLIGLGITKLSCAPRFIPSIKEAIRKIDSVVARRKAYERFRI